jgi:hypothetical protein
MLLFVFIINLSFFSLNLFIATLFAFFFVGIINFHISFFIFLCQTIVFFFGSHPPIISIFFEILITVNLIFG